VTDEEKIQWLAAADQHRATYDRTLDGMINDVAESLDKHDSTRVWGQIVYELHHQHGVSLGTALMMATALVRLAQRKRKNG
jgi:hypothetical protein